MADPPLHVEPFWEACPHRLAAEDVHVEDDDGETDWPVLMAYCGSAKGHDGEHAFGPWIDPATGRPAFSDEPAAAAAADQTERRTT